MAKSDKELKVTELGAVLKSTRKAFIGIGIFSAFINLLMLTGPIYMLQVYDRVLISNSKTTLIVLSIIMVGLYVFMGFLEFIRSRVLVRVGNQIEGELSARTFGVWMTQGLYGKLGSRNRPLDDLSAIKNFAGGPGPGALFDLPWVPLFIAVIWYLHWTLGVMALAGAIVLLIVAIMNEMSTRDTLMKSRGHLMQSRQVAEHAHRQSDSVTAMGMSGNIRARWEASHNEGAALHTESADRAGGYTAVTKSFRMAIQSGILGLGCALAILQIITPGAMIAGSIIMGRALAPIQMAIGQWKGFVNARGAYDRLDKFYEMIPAEEEALQLPEPKGVITASHVTAVPPGSQKPVLSDINFELKPGQGLGVIGPSASGKSTLARLLVGVWMPVRGSVRLDGATFDQWNRETLGKHIGYLPQDVALFDGTIRDNIARFDAQAQDENIVQAAERAGVHDMILHMENGYETKIGQDGGTVLSGGQVQRIALARALYGDPQILVLDEPNANLDNEGDNALTKAIAGCRQRGKTVIVMTHRPSAIVAVDMLLMISGGQQKDFGPKEDVLARLRAESPQGDGPKGGPRGAQRPPSGQASRALPQPGQGNTQVKPRPQNPQPPTPPQPQHNPAPKPAAIVPAPNITQGRSFSLSGAPSNAAAKPAQAKPTKAKPAAKKKTAKTKPKKDDGPKESQS